ncbi:hypothetical protein [Tateyamaria sp. SN6-1]|uniref:hypothetical protein n=1 Tax=Tateyamaria sp. SN6-1 TaxID=3092148 RepID=UPI0039F617BC
MGRFPRLSTTEAMTHRHSDAVIIDPIGAGFAILLCLPRAHDGGGSIMRDGQL